MRRSSPRIIADRWARTLRYLRVSVTDRCNLRCRYCMAPGGIPLLPHADILRYEEIAAVVRAAVGLGVTSVRITGGEPLVRLGLADLVRRLREVAGLDDLSMTTNGVLLAAHAHALAQAGLGRVNISLDSLDPAEYADITRGGQLSAVLEGLQAALAAGLEPVKVNAVMLGQRDDDELRRWMEPFIALARRLPVHVRFIEHMPLAAAATTAHGPLVAETLASLGATAPDGMIAGAGPARYWRLDGAPGAVGLIAPMSEPFCGGCNRLRLTARGEVRSCLFAAPSVDLRPWLRPRVDAAAVAAALSRCWRAKRAGREGSMPGAGAHASMCQVGG
jgi:cyclic pyranopterin phosphate synthase